MRNRSILSALTLVLLTSLPMTGQAQLLPAIYRNHTWDSKHCSPTNCYSFAEAIDAGNIASSTSYAIITIERRDSSNDWVVKQKLAHPEGRKNAGILGTFDIAGDFLIAVGSSNRYNNEHAVYVFRKIDDQWVYSQDFPITRPAGFDTSVIKSIVMHGDTALINAVSYDYGPQPFVSLNRVHVYLRGKDGKYARRAVISPPLGQDPEEALPMALEGSRALVASAGSVFLYERGSAGWPLKQVFAPIEPLRGLLTFPAIHGDTIALGAPFTYYPGQLSRSGAVQIYRRTSAGDWALAQSLPPPQHDPSGPLLDWRLGERIALDDARMVIAAGQQQFALLYERRSGSWARVARLSAPDGVLAERMLLTNNSLVVRYQFANGLSHGRYVFELPELGVLPDE